jgi:hypothetical protein
MQLFVIVCCVFAWVCARANYEDIMELCQLNSYLSGGLLNHSNKPSGFTESYGS